MVNKRLVTHRVVPIIVINVVIILAVIIYIIGKHKKLTIGLGGLALVQAQQGQNGATVYFPIMDDPNGYDTPLGHVPPHYLQVSSTSGTPFTLGKGRITIALQAKEQLGDPDQTFFDNIFPLSLFAQGGTIGALEPISGVLTMPAGKIKIRNTVPGETCKTEYKHCPPGVPPTICNGRSPFLVTTELTLTDEHVTVSGIDPQGTPTQVTLSFPSGGYLYFENGPLAAPPGTPTPVPNPTPQPNPHFGMYYMLVTPAPTPTVTPAELWMGDCSHYTNPGLRCVPILKY